jgi:hypothetical protein
MMEIMNPDDQVAQAKKVYQQGDYHEAARQFGAAVEAYRAQDKALLAAEMANNQSVALLQAGDPQGALDAALGTDAVFELAGESLKQAMALGNQASALDALNELLEAEEKYHQSARMLKDLGEDKLHANVMQSLSALQLRSGRQLEALTSMQAGIDGVEKPGLRQRILKKLLNLPGKLLNRG